MYLPRYTLIRDRGGRYTPPGINRVNDNDIDDNVVDNDAGNVVDDDAGHVVDNDAGHVVDNDGHLDPV